MQIFHATAAVPSAGDGLATTTGLVALTAAVLLAGCATTPAVVAVPVTKSAEAWREHNASAHQVTFEVPDSWEWNEANRILLLNPKAPDDDMLVICVTAADSGQARTMVTELVGLKPATPALTGELDRSVLPPGVSYDEGEAEASKLGTQIYFGIADQPVPGGHTLMVGLVQIPPPTAAPESETQAEPTVAETSFEANKRRWAHIVASLRLAAKPDEVSP